MHKEPDSLPLFDELNLAEEMMNDPNFIRSFPGVQEPLPGKYTTRPGARLKRSEIHGLINNWLNKSIKNNIFVVQGGNRYVAEHVKRSGHQCYSLKLMSIEKAKMYTHLLTIISKDEMKAQIEIKIGTSVFTGTRQKLLYDYGDYFLDSPFEPSTNDLKLKAELNNALSIISSGAYKLENLEYLKQVMRGTKISEKFSVSDDMCFFDDLFYRGRTLYTLAVLVHVCGGNPHKIRLTTICCDNNSKDLVTPYHYVMRPDVLYPFENSVRTEQGFWQNTGKFYEFIDMGAYLEFLNVIVPHDINLSTTVYEEFYSKIVYWAGSFLGISNDITLVFPLVWLIIYHKIYNITPDLERIADQKGYKIGVCVPFMLLMDRFISQEETVEARKEFKNLIKERLQLINSIGVDINKEFQDLKIFYESNRRTIDYAALNNLLVIE